MTPSELAAFNAGIAHAASLAQIAAVTIEIRDDARHVRQQAAAAALHGLAEGLKQAAGGASKSGLTLALESNAGYPGIHSPRSAASRATAIAQGFTGDTCDACGSSEMKRSGTCATCQSCGSTTGCG